MSFAIKGLALLVVVGVAACAPPPPAPVAARPTDTGNMAYPAPLPQGNITTTAPARTSPAATTGNMAYPAPLPQGTVPTRP